LLEGHRDEGHAPRESIVYARTTEAPVLLVGAAHVVDLADPLRRLLGDRTLDGVAVELDHERADALLGPGADASRRSGGPLFARLWSLVQRRLGAKLGGGLPGAEMKTAALYAQERNLPLFLIDDPIRLTLVSLVRSMPLKERVALLVGAFVGLFVPARVVEREMERYVEGPEEYSAELRRASPTLARVLIDDRNEHMADRLTDLRGRGYGRIAAVVGDAHLPGLRAALGRRGVPVEVVSFGELRGAKGPEPSSS
jgi:pheromone shutdown protein TraB